MLFNELLLNAKKESLIEDNLIIYSFFLKIIQGNVRFFRISLFLYYGLLLLNYLSSMSCKFILKNICVCIQYKEDIFHLPSFEKILWIFLHFLQKKFLNLNLSVQVNLFKLLNHSWNLENRSILGLTFYYIKYHSQNKLSILYQIHLLKIY
jgi:hypothetical protein